MGYHHHQGYHNMIMLDYFFAGIILHFALIFDYSNAAIQDCNGPESNDSVQECIWQRA